MLYNTLLVDGLSQFYLVSFLTGRIRHTDGIVEERTDASGRHVFEYDARFPDLFEPGGRFDGAAARYWYQDRVDSDMNPVYAHLAAVYEHVLNRVRPAIVNTHNLNAACAYIHSRRSPGSSGVAVATIHDVEPTQLRFIARHQTRFGRFVAISSAVRRALVQAGIGDERIRVVPNGLHLAPFLDASERERASWSAIAQREGLDPVAFQVVVPARRVPGKGIQHAIRGFDLFRRSFGGSCRLLISGSGLGDPAYEEELRRQARESADPASIHFLGPLTYSEMPAVLGACDVSLLPSIVPEGFGYANIEAMATGTAIVVTTHHGGTEDYLDPPNNGLAVPIGDPTAITEALALVARDRRLARRIREAAKATAERFEASSMIRAYLNLFSEVVEEQHAVS